MEPAYVFPYFLPLCHHISTHTHSTISFTGILPHTYTNFTHYILIQLLTPHTYTNFTHYILIQILTPHTCTNTPSEVSGSGCTLSMVGRRQCLKQHLESSFFGSAGEGRGKERIWGEGRKEKREERREGGAERGVLLYIYSDSNVSFAGLLSTVAPLRALRVSGILLTYLLLHPSSPHFFSLFP